MPKHSRSLSASVCVLIMMFMFSCGWSDKDQLYISSAGGDVEKIRELLAKGVDPNHRFLHLQREFQPYETPIIAAAENGHLDIVKMLVEAGADIDAQNTYNSQTALFKAVLNRHRKVVDYLLDKGADPMTSEHFGLNILMLAIKQNDFNLVRHLIRYGAWPDSRVRDMMGKAGNIGDDAVRIAQHLKRPYVGYLLEQRRICEKMLKTNFNCKRY